MKRKLIIIIFVSLAISVISSCYTMCYYYDSMIVKIESCNAQLNNSYYSDCFEESIPFEKYSLSVKCRIKDTLIYSEKLTTYLQDFSFINYWYCAYDPGLANFFQLKDSLKSVNIYSIFDFDDESKKDSNLIKHFQIGYSSLTTWNVPDSITGIIPLKKIEDVNRLLSDQERYSENLFLYFTPIHKPKYEMQRFVIYFEFYSGTIMSDTADLVNLK